jgi:WD40 repeat protein/predicted Ser/Thr protein kinase
MNSNKDEGDNSMSTASVYCDSCGAANRAQARFCIRCGQALQYNAGEPHQANPPQQASGAPTGRLLPGTLLGGRYRVLQVLGQGGMGAVYQVEDSRLSNARRAVKEMSQRGLSPEELPEAQEAFKREAHLLATLVHPNLPRISDHFSDNGRWYLVMDYIEGETLADRLSKTQAGKLPLDTVLELGIQLCTVLHYLHSRPSPIIFRDLKPSNIMLTADEHLYLIDFGIARLFKPGKTKDTTAYGSPGYAAPEQYGRMQTSARSDLYSLGATLHQLVSGNNPDDMPFRFSPLHLQDEVGGTDLETLILRMVEMDPQKRPATALAVKQELQQLMEHRKQAILHPSPAPRDASPITFTVLSGSGDLKWIAGEPYYAVGYGDGLIQIWQCTTNQLVSTCYGHTARVTDVAWSPDGTRLASASDDGTVRIWKAMTGQSLAVASRPGATQYRQAVWSPDGTHLVVYSYGKYEEAYQIIDILDANTGSTITFFELPKYNRVHQLWWFPDGTRIIFTDIKSMLRILEATTGRLLASYKFPGGVIYSPDCTYFVNVVEEIIEIREIATGHVITSYKVSDTAGCIQWSPDSRYLAFALKEAIQVREALTGRLVASYTGHKDQVNRIAWHPFDTRIASSSDDKIIQVWEAMKGHHLITYNRKSCEGVYSEWSPDGTQLISYSTFATIQVVNRATEQVSTIYRGHDKRAHTVIWSPDGTKVASGSSDKTVQVWHARTGHHIATYIHKDLVDSVAWSPDSKQIASLCGNDCEVKVWHAETGHHLATYNSGQLGTVAWSPDGRYIAAFSRALFSEGIVEVWEVTTKQRVMTYTMSNPSRSDDTPSGSWSPDSTRIASGYGNFIVWSPDGKYIVSNKKVEIHDAMTGGWPGGFLAEYEPADNYRSSVHIWETRTGSSRVICQGTAWVESAAWSPDGNYLAAGHKDGIVRVWDIAKDRAIAVHRGYMCYGPTGGVAWSPDGNYLAYTAFSTEIQTYPEAN